MRSLQSFSKSENWISKHNDLQIVLNSNGFFIEAPQDRDAQSISVHK